jgi:hypothetical protein
VAKFAKDPIYRTKVFVRKRPYCQKFYFILFIDLTCLFLIPCVRDIFCIFFYNLDNTRVFHTVDWFFLRPSRDEPYYVVEYGEKLSGMTTRPE